jgi:hypothetical protein
MARGIEELAEMQVTGPVQGGDMVMKPDQAPVGAAALLNKMSRQNTPGIFKLPMPDKEMPNFMKVAAEGVEQQTAKGDTINQMAGELMRQGVDTRGMGMDEIIQIYEQTFGSPGDVDEFGVSQIDPSDWRTIMKMLDAGMSWEEIEAQYAMNTMKNRAHKDAARVEAFAPEGHQLAYITPDEQDMLRMMGGSGETNPMTGIKQFPEISKKQAEEKYGVSPEQWSQGFSPGERVTEGGHKEDPMTGLIESMGKVESDTGQAKEIYDRLAKESKGEDKNISDMIKNAALTSTGILPMMKFTEGLDKVAQAWERKQVKDLISKIGTGDAATGWGNLLHDFKRDPNRAEKWFEDWEDELGDEDWDEETRTRGKIDWEKMTPEEKTNELIRMASAGGGDKFQKTFNPNEYYKDPKNWDAKEMAQAQAEGNLSFTRDNTQIIEEGRRRLAEERGEGRDRHPGTSRPTEQVTEEVVDETTTTTDPRAGQFNVGGTMPYTEDIRTAGVEMDVPLGRRFQTDKEGKYRGSTGMDLNEAMQYATLGGYGQLEPFQEYLARRREHLGEDEPVYFDEEGNVIYSPTTDV